MKIRSISKILLLPISIIVLPLQYAHGWECEVTLDGPNVIKVGQPITLTASGTPEGGSYSWSATPNLIPSGATAQLTGYEPESSEYIWVTVKYTSPSGRKCSAVKGIWVCLCYVKITGPTEVKVGDPPITLTAEGDPSGGSYQWSDTLGLVPNGPEAQFTAQSPGDVTIEVIYKAPEGDTCSDTHTVTVFECSVFILGPSEVAVSDTITLTTEGEPPGGTYSWTPIPGLEANGPEAQFTAQSPGDVTIEVTYTSPDGETCSDTHTVTVFECSVTISGPLEVGVDDTITLTAEGDPSGGTYEWSDTPGLVPNGPEAQFTAQSQGEVTIEVTYTLPEGRTCGDTHTLAVFECSVIIDGPPEVNVCESITLTAEGEPPGGTYSWTPIPGLEANGEEAKFIGQSPGDVTIMVTYTTPEGKTCNRIHAVTVSEECPTLWWVPLFKQCSAPWGTDTYDNIKPTVCGKGCALTSAVMILWFYGVTTGADGKEVNPRNLNEWLKSQADGYKGSGWVNWKAIERYSGKKVLYNGKIDGREDEVLLRDICDGRPVILNVPGHFVVATGVACINNERTWSIKDPGYNVTTLKDYGNTYSGLRRFKSP